MNKVWHGGGLIYLLLLSSMPVLAASFATVTVKATVNSPPPCVINKGKPIEVKFGDVMTTRVNGSNYRKEVEYTLDCTSGANNAMKIQIQGSGAAFNSKALQTTNPNLAIKLEGQGVPLPLNSWMNFDFGLGKPTLWAVPVQKAGTTLTAGDFNASATMKVEYQ